LHDKIYYILPRNYKLTNNGNTYCVHSWFLVNIALFMNGSTLQVPMIKVCEKCYDDGGTTVIRFTEILTLEECKHYCFKNKKCQGINYIGGKPANEPRCYISSDPQSIRTSVNKFDVVYRKGTMRIVMLCNIHFQILPLWNIGKDLLHFLP